MPDIRLDNELDIRPQTEQIKRPDIRVGNELDIRPHTGQSKWPDTRLARNIRSIPSSVPANYDLAILSLCEDIEFTQVPYVQKVVTNFHSVILLYKMILYKKHTIKQ